MRFLFAILLIQAAFLARQPAAKIGVKLPTISGSASLTLGKDSSVKLLGTAPISTPVTPVPLPIIPTIPDVGFKTYTDISEIHKRLGHLQTARAALEKDFDQISKEIEAAIRHSKEIKVKEQASYEAILELERERDKLEEDKRNFELGLNDAEDNAVLAKLEEVKNLLDKAQHDMEIELKKYQATLKEIAGRIARLEKDIFDIKKIIAEIELSIKELEKRVDATKAEIAKIQKTIGELVAYIAKLEREKKTLEGDLVKITALIANIRIKLNNAKILKLKYEQDVARAHEYIVHFKNHIAEEQAIVADLEAQIKAHKKIIADNMLSIEHQQKRIAALRIKIATEVKTIATLTNDLEKAISDSKKIDAALHMKVAEIKKKKEDLLVEYGKLKDWEHRLSDLKAEIELKKKAKEHQLAEIKRHEAEISAANKEKDAAKKSYDSFVAKITPYVNSYVAAIKKLEQKRIEIAKKREAIKASIKATDAKILVILGKIKKESNNRAGLKATLAKAFARLEELQARREKDHHAIENNEAEKLDLESQKAVIGDTKTLDSDIEKILATIKNYD